MADATKQASIHGGLFSEIKTLFSLSKTQKTLQFAYGCMLGLVLFTVFLALSPSSNSSPTSLSNLYSVSSFNTSSIFSEQSYRSHFSSIFSYFFPNSSQTEHKISPDYSILPSNENQSRDLGHQAGDIKQNQTKIEQNQTGIEQNQTRIEQNKTGIEQNQSRTEQNQIGIEQNQSRIEQNQTQIEITNSPIMKKQTTTEIPKSGIMKNQSSTEISRSPVFSNSTKNLTPKPSVIAKNSTENQTEKQISQKGEDLIWNLTSSQLHKQSNGTNLVVSVKQRSEDLVKDLINCDLFDGEWVHDDSYPLYKPGSCSLIDEQFNCFVNGRPDNGFYKLKWKPKRCSVPRLNGTHMLEMLRGKRLVFVGDSLNRNMWESLVCILKSFVKDQTKVYEASGKHHFRTEPSYSFIFKEYDCTIEFFVSPFLVQEWEMADTSGSKKETLRLDLVGRAADQYKTADIIVFNTGHWWTHDKTAKGKDYYQEGRHIYHDLNVLEAFHKALNTWGRWVDANVDPKKSMVFFRGYSASHFSGGQWNSGGQCDDETEPIKNTTYLSRYPPKMIVLEDVLNSLKTNVSYLNITRLTDYRKDGHPSIYRKQVLSKEELKSPLKFQDCSHWCLPGVPDAWNELLYAELLIKQSQNKQR